MVKFIIYTITSHTCGRFGSVFLHKKPVKRLSMMHIGNALSYNIHCVKQHVLVYREIMHSHMICLVLVREKNSKPAYKNTEGILYILCYIHCIHYVISSSQPWQSQYIKHIRPTSFNLTVISLYFTVSIVLQVMQHLSCKTGSLFNKTCFCMAQQVCYNYVVPEYNIDI